jgi:hypothetical protein
VGTKDPNPTLMVVLVNYPLNPGNAPKSLPPRTNYK